MNVQLSFLDEGITLCVPKGTTILAAQQMADLHPDTPCGGQGTCGKCLTDIRAPGGPWVRVKSCRTSAETDLEIRTLTRDGQLSILDWGETAHSTWAPWVETVELQIPPCSMGESTADWTRLIRTLESATGRSGWQTNIVLAARLGPLLRQTRGHLWAVVSQNQILELWECPRKVYMVAFDLGTTSLAGYLLDEIGTIARGGMPNPQTQYGADVIQRANHAMEHGAGVLAQCVRAALDTLSEQLCEQAGVSQNEVFAVSLVGNTCMHHLFLGISPESLACAPYNPTFGDGAVLRCVDYGLHTHPEAPLLMLPVIAGFVGGDTVGCLVAGDWEARDALTLLIDIGTNGEIVLGNRHRWIVCSTAAGPAFEGAGVCCGMRSVPGAVDHVWLEEGEICWSVIGGTEAKGICGSGLIDLVAVLRQTERIDESGRLENGISFRLGDTDVVLTQKDIRQVQLAKAAISTGIRLLARRYGVMLKDIETVCIAGAFGTFMNPDSACRIGLIPYELRSKIHPVGNAAGEGAKLVLQDRRYWDCAQRLANQAEFLELATVGDFQDTFVDELEFPEA